jgi:hypothetical protein
VVDELGGHELAGNQLVKVEIPVADLGSAVTATAFYPEDGHHLFVVGKFSPPIKRLFDPVVRSG